jgi:hypothetical protein
MRIIYTLLLLGGFFAANAQTEERTVTGRLLDESGEPMPGVSIVVKGTNTGVATDADGYYAIKAPIGAVLVFSFVGMTSKEVVVTPSNLTPLAKTEKEKKRSTNRTLPKWSPLLIQDTVANPEQGVAILSDETPMYFISQESFDPTRISRISTIGKMKASRKIGMNVPTGGYYIKTMPDQWVERFKLQYAVSIGIDRANKLPSLQNEYAQGRAENGALHWRGADQQELFSWGPAIKTLEFDGSDYPYDRHGKLTNVGEGNGMKARSTNPLAFFRTGYHSEHFLTMSTAGPKHSTMFMEIGKNTVAGIIPGSRYDRTNLSLQTKALTLSKAIKGDALTSFNVSDGVRNNRGSNLASIVGAVYRTPATFDNTNGHSARQAYNTTSSYRLADGSIRSHAPGLVDNPFGLSAEIPDRDHSKRLMSGVTLNFNDSNPIDVKATGNFERQWANSTFGLLPGHSGYVDGRITKRDEVQTVFSGMILPSFQHFDIFDFQTDFGYQFRHETRDLNRRCLWAKRNGS